MSDKLPLTSSLGNRIYIYLERFHLLSFSIVDAFSQVNLDVDRKELRRLKFIIFVEKLPLLAVESKASVELGFIASLLTWTVHSTNNKMTAFHKVAVFGVCKALRQDKYDLLTSQHKHLETSVHPLRQH